MAKKKEIKIPNKTSMNLYQVDRKNDPKRLITIGVIVIVAMTLIMAKFLILDPILELNAYEAENIAMQSELEALQARTANYNELKEEYYRYGESYSNDEEQLVDRIVITSLLSETTSDLAEITSTSITDNLVAIRVVTADLDKLAQFRNRLESNDLVRDVVVYSATRSTGDVISSVAFKCVAKEGE